MTERRANTTLGIMETASLHTIATADNPYEVRDALVELGFTHLQMEPQKIGQALDEIWAGMHGRSGLENLGIVATVFGTIVNSGPNPLTLEYAVALARDTRDKKKADGK